MSAGGFSQPGPDGADMSGGGVAQQALEQRYRRLLRCYPPRHRQVHREEMLGVLLAAAQPGQRAPSTRQTVNLVACGLAIRGRRALSWLAGPWQDALAVVSLIAPVLMLISATLVVAENARLAVQEYQILPKAMFWRFFLMPILGGPAAVMIGWLAVVLLGLTGRRRTAAAVASIPMALALLNLLADVMESSRAWSGGLPVFFVTAGVGPVVMASLAACSLAFSAGPRRGLAILGRRRAWPMIAGLSWCFGFPVILILVSPFAYLSPISFSLLGVLAIAVALVLTRVRSTVDRRVAVLVATALLLNLGSTFPVAGDLIADAVPRLASLLFVVLVWSAAFASARGWRIGRASRAG